MTISNGDLLRTPLHMIGSDTLRTYRFILEKRLEENPCPSCWTPVDYLTAAGIELNDWTGADDDLTRPCTCPTCGRGLLYSDLHGLATTIPAGTWSWRLVPQPDITEMRAGITACRFQGRLQAEAFARHHRIKVEDVQYVPTYANRNEPAYLVARAMPWQPPIGRVLFISPRNLQESTLDWLYNGPGAPKGWWNTDAGEGEAIIHVPTGDKVAGPADWVEVVTLAKRLSCRLVMTDPFTPPVRGLKAYEHAEPADELVEPAYGAHLDDGTVVINTGDETGPGLEQPDSPYIVG